MKLRLLIICLLVSTIAFAQKVKPQVKVIKKDSSATVRQMLFVLNEQQSEELFMLVKYGRMGLDDATEMTPKEATMIKKFGDTLGSAIFNQIKSWQPKPIPIPPTKDSTNKK